MPDLDLAAARALCDAATPGPWDPGIYGRVGNKDEAIGDIYRGRDREFIAAARSLLPAALDRIEALEAKCAVERKARHAAEKLNAEEVVARRTNLEAQIAEQDARIAEAIRLLRCAYGCRECRDKAISVLGES